ncbi:MAG: hypothetical protein R2737_15680 [Candidatus Nanopelagicales bacterium]
MSADATRLPVVPASSAAPASAVGRLAVTEAGRYARHPLLLIGVVLTAVLSAQWRDATGELDSGLTYVLAPALFIGVFGIVVMYRLTRSSDRLAEASGSPALGMRARTAALAWAVLVPFSAGLLWFVWAAWRYSTTVTPPNGLPFGGVGGSWSYAWLFSLGAVSCAGGPIIGLDLARWFPRRGIAVVTGVLLVIASMALNVLMQPGVLEGLRYVRVFWPFTWFGGQFGIEGDENRTVILTGSPEWYVAYLVSLCALGILVALYRDRERPRERLRVGIVVTTIAAVVLGVITMTSGVQETMVNPIPSTGAAASPGE